MFKKYKYLVTKVVEADSMKEAAQIAQAEGRVVAVEELRYDPYKEENNDE